jgi:hypothetical protein
MTNDYRLAYLGLADRRRITALSGHTNALYRHDEDSSSARKRAPAACGGYPARNDDGA